MNLTAILPLAGARSAGSEAKLVTSTGSTGFAARFATQFAACGDATSVTGDTVDGDGEEVPADLVTLAALASRTATSTFPLHAALVTEAGGGTAGPEQPETLGPDETVAATPRAELTDVASGGAADALPSGGSQLPTDDVVVVHAAAPTLVAPVASPVASPVDADTDGEPLGHATTLSSRTAGTGDDTAPTPAGTGDLDGGAPPAMSAGQATDDTATSEVEGDGVGRSTPPEAGSRGRERHEVTSNRVSAPANVRVDSTDAPAPTGPAVTTAAPGRTDVYVPSAAAQRVLDIVTRLEDAPPPRVVVIETGEMRVRIGLDGGVVRLTVLGTLPEGGEEFLRETADALEAGGFGAEFDGGSGGDTDTDPQDHLADDGVPPATAATARPGRARAGLQL